MYCVTEIFESSEKRQTIKKNRQVKVNLSFAIFEFSSPTSTGKQEHVNINVLYYSLLSQWRENTLMLCWFTHNYNSLQI